LLKVLKEKGNLEFDSFLSIEGSAGETRSQLYRVLDYNYKWRRVWNKTDFENLSGKINNFISYLNKILKGTKFQ
jgi:hypothetical protein